MFTPIFKNKFSYIYVIDNANAFKIGKTLGFTKAHHKILRKSGHGLGELPKVSELPLNISATAEASDFKFRMQLGLPRAIIQSHSGEKWAWRWARKLPKIWEFLFNISATAEASDFIFGTRLGFAKGHHKITPKGKVGVAFG